VDEGMKNALNLYSLGVELGLPLTETLADFLRKVLLGLLLRPMHYWRFDAAWRMGFIENFANLPYKNKWISAAFVAKELL